MDKKEPAVTRFGLFEKKGAINCSPPQPIYTPIHNETFKNPTLSTKAKGLYALFCCIKKEQGEVTFDDLARFTPESEEELEEIINELLSTKTLVI